MNEPAINYQEKTRNVISRAGGSELSLGMVNTFTGIAIVLGSILVTMLPLPFHYNLHRFH